MYAKLFTSIYQGTLRGNSHGLLVFTNLLAHADHTGSVDMHPRAIAEEVGLSTDQVRVALVMLESPDAESRSPESEGRRIVRMDDHRDWGWRIVNYAKYRAIKNEDDRKEQNRIAQEKWRNKNKQSKPCISDDQPDKPMQKQKQKQIQKQEGKNTAPEGVSLSVWQDFKTLRAKQRAPITDTAIKGIQREAEKAGISLDAALTMCCERSWRGFKADWMGENQNSGAKSQFPNNASATVPGRNGLDPELLRKNAEDAAWKPPKPEVKSMLAQTVARIKGAAA